MLIQISCNFDHENKKFVVSAGQVGLPGLEEAVSRGQVQHPID